MDIRYCARLFTRFDLSRAPVVENGEVIGIVSLTDLVIKGMMRRTPRRCRRRPAGHPRHQPAPERIRRPLD
jgi:hypothetical protein